MSTFYSLTQMSFWSLEAVLQLDNMLFVHITFTKLKYLMDTTIIKVSKYYQTPHLS